MLAIFKGRVLNDIKTIALRELHWNKTVSFSYRLTCVLFDSHVPSSAALFSHQHSCALSCQLSFALTTLIHSHINSHALLSTFTKFFALSSTLIRSHKLSCALTYFPGGHQLHMPSRQLSYVLINLREHQLSSSFIALSWTLKRSHINSRHTL